MPSGVDESVVERSKFSSGAHCPGENFFEGGFVSESILDRQRRIALLKKIISFARRRLEEEIRRQLRDFVRQSDASEIAEMEQD